MHTEPSNEAPGLLLRELVVFPTTKQSFVVARPKTISTLRAIDIGGTCAVFTQRNSDVNIVESTNELYEVGTLVRLLQVTPLSDGSLVAGVEGLRRVRLREAEFREEVVRTVFTDIADSGNENDESLLDELSALEAIASDLIGLQSRLKGRHAFENYRFSLTSHSAPILYAADFKAWTRAVTGEVAHVKSKKTEARHRIYDIAERLGLPVQSEVDIIAEPFIQGQVNLLRRAIVHASARAAWRERLDEEVTAAISSEHRQLFLREVVQTALSELGEVAPRPQVNPVFRGKGFQTRADCEFALMPFDDKFRPVFDEIIKPTCALFGVTCSRGDDLFGTTPIMEDIWKSLNEAAVVVSDLTSRNPNVFYETGLAHALAKNVVVLTQDLSDVPFDLRHIRCVVYTDSVAGFRKLERDLANMLGAVGLTRTHAS